MISFRLLRPVGSTVFFLLTASFGAYLAVDSARQYGNASTLQDFVSSLSSKRIALDAEVLSAKQSDFLLDLLTVQFPSFDFSFENTDALLVTNDDVLSQNKIDQIIATIRMSFPNIVMDVQELCVGRECNVRMLLDLKLVRVGR